MAQVGYARVSSVGQSLELQVEQLAGAGCDPIFREKVTGTTTDGRAELERALEYVRDGDAFVVTRIDRLARSVGDLDAIIRGLRAKGVHFRSLQQGEFDTSNATSALFLNILGAFAAFETQLRAERQAEGIARAKETGRTKTGRPFGRPKVDRERILQMHADGVRPSDIARRLAVGRSTVFEAIKEAKRGPSGEGP